MSKSIFKIIIGTIVAMVISVLIIEYINVELSAMQLTQLTDMSIRQACEFFSQETYKQERNNFTGMLDIKDENGNIAVDGNIYSGMSDTDIYGSLYTTNDFKEFIDSFQGNWKEFDLMTQIPETEEEFYMQEVYADNLMTPLNLGITYLDKDALTKITRWNIASLLSNGSKSAFKDIGGLRPYVVYKGFRIYLNEISITDITYKVFNITNATEAEEFRQQTNIEPINLGITDPSDDRAKICIADIHYDIRVAYEGITFLKQIAEFTWNNRVEGKSGASNPDNTEFVLAEDSLSNQVDTGSLRVPRDIKYFIVR